MPPSRANPGGYLRRKHRPLRSPLRSSRPTNPRPPRAWQATRTINENDLDDEDDEENWLSVAAIEAELKPKVIEAFDNIAGTYKRLRRLQDRDVRVPA